MLKVSLRQLGYFVTAAETGSIAEAARMANVAQPSVSWAILKMEELLDLELFVRQHAKGVSLTAAGHRLLPQARSLLRMAEEFETLAQVQGHDLTGTLTVGCYSTLAPAAEIRGSIALGETVEGSLEATVSDGWIFSDGPAGITIIAQPDSAFTDKDKFIIDQYIMNGGKALWLIDPVNVDRDTLNLKGYSIGLNKNLRIDDMMFKYGVRLNNVLVQDLQCATIPINVGFKNGQPNFKPFPWVYNPLILPDNAHPIVKNLDLIRMDYSSTIDTIKANGIKKTILLKTSRYSKTQPTPARLFLASVQYKPKPKQYNTPFLPVAVLLEGSFNSFVEYRLPTTLLADSNFKYIDKGKKTNGG